MPRLSTAGVTASAAVVPVRIRPGGPGITERGAGRAMTAFSRSSSLHFAKQGLGVSEGVNGMDYM